MVAVVVIVRVTIKIKVIVITIRLSVQHHIVLVAVVVVPVVVVPNPLLNPNIGGSPEPLILILVIRPTSPKMCIESAIKGIQFFFEECMLNSGVNFYQARIVPFSAKCQRLLDVHSCGFKPQTAHVYRLSI